MNKSMFVQGILMIVLGIGFFLLGMQTTTTQFQFFNFILGVVELFLGTGIVFIELIPYVEDKIFK